MIYDYIKSQRQNYADFDAENDGPTLKYLMAATRSVRVLDLQSHYKDMCYYA